jgi:hypothetical protein
MAKELKTVYMKIPIRIIRALQRIAESQHRTLAAQVAMILEEWLEKHMNPKPEIVELKVSE